MTEHQSTRAGHWTGGPLPSNVRIGPNSVITGDCFSGALAFKRFFSRMDPALVIGSDCIMEGVLFNVGTAGRIFIGDRCHFQDAFLIAEAEIRIGSRVFIGWHATVLDSNLHPIDPEVRMADLVACSPASRGPRPPFISRPVVIEDDAWIGPNATVLKGVRIGAGAIVEPGAVVVHDVPPGVRVLGNPAQIIGEAEPR